MLQPSHSSHVLHSCPARYREHRLHLDEAVNQVRRSENASPHAQGKRRTATGADPPPCSLAYRFFLPAGCGFWLAKRQLFPLAAARGSGQLILNVLLPALLFNKVVQSIDNDNVGALGPIVLVGAFYELLGLALAWLVRLLLPVPSNFRNGLLVAGMIGNWVSPRQYSGVTFYGPKTSSLSFSALVC